jgi:GT2 family glycosyltransferase
MKKVTSSIIVCTRNRLHDMLCALASIQTQTEQPQELIVVDSSDVPLDTQEEFIKLFNKSVLPQSILIYKHTKPGLPYQRNVGARLATQDILYYFDDDSILEPEYMAHMNKIFSASPHYAGGMGSVTNMRSAPSAVDYAKAFFMLQRDFSSGNFTFSGMPTHTYGLKIFKEVEVLGGCCMAYRRSVFAKHQFDEGLKGYAFMEDCDFSRRVSYDAPLFYNPEAKLKHMVSPAARDRVIDNRAMYMKNYSYLFYKNFYSRNRLKVIAYWWSVAGLFVEAIARRDKEYVKGYYKGLKEYYKGSQV